MLRCNAFFSSISTLNHINHTLYLGDESAFVPHEPMLRVNMHVASSMYLALRVTLCRQVSGGLGTQPPHFGIFGGDPVDVCRVRHVRVGERGRQRDSVLVHDVPNRHRGLICSRLAGETATNTQAVVSIATICRIETASSQQESLYCGRVGTCGLPTT